MLVDDPDAIKDVHLSYYNAGAVLATVKKRLFRASSTTRDQLSSAILVLYVDCTAVQGNGRARPLPHYDPQRG